MKKIEGKIKRIIFEKDGWFVFEIEGVGKCTGNLPPMVQAGNYVVVEGVEKKTKYGTQFVVKKCSMSKLEGIKSILLQLPGIGQVTATKLIKEYGEDVFDVIKNWPEKFLLDVENDLELLERLIKENELLNKFYAIGLTPNKVRKIYGFFGKESIKILNETPYRLIEIPGFGFKTTDMIALRSGINPGSIERINACLDYIINDAQHTGGHCWLFVSELTRIVFNLLIESCRENKTSCRGITREKIEKAIQEHPGIIIKKGQAWFKHLVLAEKIILKKWRGEYAAGLVTERSHTGFTV